MSADYTAARNGAAVILRTDRALLRVFGREPVKMLQGLLTNDLAGAPPERAVYAAMLTPKGKMVADGLALKRGADVWLDVDAAALEALVTHMQKYVPPLFARVEEMKDLSIVGLYGPRAPAIATAVLGFNLAAGDEDDAVETEWSGNKVTLIRTHHTGDDGFDIIIASADANSLIEHMMRAGAAPLSAETLDVLRIEAGRPRWGRELDDTVIPLEAGLRQRAISETKGCYTGQEIIIRILHRGHVNWQLRGLLLGDGAPPAAGDTLVRPDETRAVARVTSVAVSPLMRQTIALAYVRREVEPGAVLRLGSTDGAEARVVDLPFTPRPSRSGLTAA
jgi:folate-binding protein YgfZ